MHAAASGGLLMDFRGVATQTGAPFAPARKVADAVLYESCTLHPYRASTTGNRLRRQAGVLVPPALSADGEEYDFQHTECLMEPEAGATLAVEPVRDEQHHRSLAQHPARPVAVEIGQALADARAA